MPTKDDVNEEEKEESPCDAVSDKDCEERPGCKLVDGSSCPASIPRCVSAYNRRQP